MRRHTRHEWMTRCILRHCVPSSWLQHTATDCNIHCNTFLKTTTPEIRKETYLGILRHCVSFSWRDALMCVTWWGGLSDLIFTRCVTPFSLDLGATTWLWGGQSPFDFGGGSVPIFPRHGTPISLHVRAFSVAGRIHVSGLTHSRVWPESFICDSCVSKHVFGCQIRVATHASHPAYK